MSSCCPKPEKPPCHGSDDGGNVHTHKASFDYILYGSLSIIGAAVILYPLFPYIEALGTFSYAVTELLGTMWWGIVLGILFVGAMTKIPKEYFSAIMGAGDSINGIFRATLAGLLLDLCSHGILMIGAKLYERGASLAQVMAFLIASPWNSFSLTLILISLIGLKWTLVFILGSAVIAIVTGFIYRALTRMGVFAPNPNSIELPKSFSLREDASKRLKTFKPDRYFFKDIIWSGLKEAKMLIRWLLLGVVIAAAIRTFVPTDVFATWFGPSLFGLFMTLIAATIIEVCSEGSAPIASEILNRAGAPGNAFTFLMAGVSTDYTEIMIIREFTKKWVIALSLPLLTMPQIIVVAFMIQKLY